MEFQLRRSCILKPQHEPKIDQEIDMKPPSTSDFRPNRGRLAFMIFRQRFTARVFLNFLGRLLRLTRKTRKKVFLIVDGHPVHKSRSVTRWLDEHREQIRVFFLPSYSPELNPDELLNQDVKTNALGRIRPINVQEMMDNVRSYLRITQARPTVVKNYFCERHVRYAAS